MTWILLYAIVSLFLSLGSSECVGPVLPDFSEAFESSNFSGGVQILIPGYQFNCIGGVVQWSAHVSLQQNVSELMEFHALRPVDNADGAYEVIYHNDYMVENVNGSVVTLTVDPGPAELDNGVIPVDVGNIVGLYIENISQSLELLFESDPIDGGVDVYYWEGVTQRRCKYSICDPDCKVIRGVRPLVSWIVDEDLALATLNHYISNSRSSPAYCAAVDTLPECPPVSSTSSTVMLSTSFPSFSPSSFIEASSLTFSMENTISPSSTPSQTPTDNTSILGFTKQTFVALVVTIFLFLIIVILLLAILLCFMQKKSSQWKVSSEAPAIDNPDYNGVISMAMTSPAVTSPENGEPLQGPDSPHNCNEKMSFSPGVPQFDDAHYYSTARVQGAVSSYHTKLDTQQVQSPNSNSTEKIFPSLERQHIPTFDPHDYDAPLDSNRVETVEKLPLGNHYYSCPHDEEKCSSSLVMDQAQVGGNVYDAVGGEDLPLVPKMQDPEVSHGYDEIKILMRPERAHTISGPSSSSTGKPKDASQEVYAIVPTLEQRKFSSWRYEITAGQGYEKLRFFEESSVFWAPASTTSDLYQQLAANKYREIPQQEIQLMTTLGQGQFGSVSKGVWNSSDGDYEVAVKMLKPEASEEDQVKLLQEAAIMGQFAHKNVVKLHGVVTVGEPPVMIVLEFMPRGDLRSYLRSIRPKQGRWKAPPSGLTKLLLKFCRDIALGMSYLSRKSFVHRDLAARNILLGSDLTCKIGDFGMARDLMAENNYYHSKGGIIPLRWTAPEALNYKKYTPFSDIWSYGMVLFEIWSLGHKPFNDLSNPIVIALVNSKHCQPPPPGCTRAIYQLMVQCWNPEHSLRPRFDHVCEYLDTRDEVLLQWVSSDTIPCKQAHILGAPLEESTDLYFDLQRTYQQSMLDEFNGKKRSQSTRT